MLSRFGKRALVLNLANLGLGYIQYYIYYNILPSKSLSNFNSTPLKNSPELAEPVLIVDNDTKFVFAHKGGLKAAESIVNDAYYNNKFMKKSIALQITTGICITIGLAKSRKYMIQTLFLCYVGNACYFVPVLINALNCYNLSMLVRAGNSYVWENLNEIRYIERMKISSDPAYFYSRIFGTYGTFLCISYMSPAIGLFALALSNIYSLHLGLI